MSTGDDYLAVLKAAYDYAPTSDDEIAIREDQLLFLKERVDDEYALPPYPLAACACSPPSPTVGGKSRSRATPRTMTRPSASCLPPTSSKCAAFVLVTEPPYLTHC